MHIINSNEMYGLPRLLFIDHHDGNLIAAIEAGILIKQVGGDDNNPIHPPLLEHLNNSNLSLSIILRGTDKNIKARLNRNVLHAFYYPPHEWIRNCGHHNADGPGLIRS